MMKAVLLWSSLVLSTVLSAGFFFSLGDSLVSGAFLAALGVMFEALKTYSWSQVGSARAAYLWLAVPCTILSLVASIGYASLTLEEGWSQFELNEARSTALASQRVAVQREEEALLEAMKKLPPGWTTATLRLSERLEAIRGAKQVPEVETAQGTSRKTSTLAASLGKRLGFSGEWVVATVLFAVATVLEVGIIVLVLDRRTPSSPTPGPKQGEELERFLRQAVGPEGKLLGRRRLVELGWSEREVRDHVTTLLKKGVLTHSGRGSPIRVRAEIADEK